VTSGDWSGIPGILRPNFADGSSRTPRSASPNREGQNVAHQGSCVAAVVLTVVMGGTSRAAAPESTSAVASPQSLMESDTRVRGASTRLVALIIAAHCTIEDLSRAGRPDQYHGRNRLCRGRSVRTGGAVLPVGHDDDSRPKSSTPDPGRFTHVRPRSHVVHRA
jgi:hypothetical protein